MELVLALNSLLVVAYFLVVVSFCVVVYRATHLRSLPWLAGFYVVTQAGDLIAEYFRKQGAFAPHWLAIGASFLGSLTSLLLAIVVLSEVAFLVRKGFAEVESALLELFLKAHQRIFTLGSFLIVLAALRPVSLFIFYSHPAP